MDKKAGQEGQPADHPEQAWIIESSHDAIMGMSRQGIISTWNQAAARLYGYPAEEIIGRDVDVLYPPERRDGEAEILRRIVSGEDVGQFRTDRFTKAGTLITVSLTASPIVDVTGAIVGASTVSRKFSELQDARDRFEARIGVERAEAQDAQDQFEVRVSGERAEAQDALDRFEARVSGQRAEAQNAQDQFEVRVSGERAEAQDARDRFEARVGAERTEAQDGRDRYEALQDSNRLAAERTKARAEAQLQQAQRLENLGQLAGGVAHDFNNLLAVILNYASFVAEELDAASVSDCAEHCRAARRDVGQIQQAATRAADLTRQLLTFARREVVRPQVLSLNDVITGVAEMLRRSIGEHVELVTSLAGGLWPVLADPGQIEQVLVNLAVNARDAMEGGGTLTIDTSNFTVDAAAIAGGSPARPGRNVRLRVSDTGTGMPADVIDRAFEPFFTTKAEGTGTGLGLATVYGILAQADGHIRIYSEPGTGTTFSITLPVTDQAAVPVPEPASYHRTPKGETILVVEDAEALREVTERIFTRHGYHVLTAASGPEALDLARQHQGEIHLLVTDVVMPHMLGKEVAEKMSEIKPEIEVLYMSGYARPVLASQGRLDPGVALVEKPFSESALLAAAGQVLNGHFRGYATTREQPVSPA
jgi:two-component system cell cycle sensor histidine kinase/response regulator CckA